MAVETEKRPPLELKTTRVFKDCLEAWCGGYRRLLEEGGTSSSKTWSILQFIIYLATEARTPMLISVVSESLPHLKRGCIRDFFAILGESPESNPFWSKTEFTYRRPNWKGVIEFFGADDSGKVRGPRRQVLFINEGNNIPWETARGLDVRTELFTFCDWNPVGEFWAHDNWVGDKQNYYGHSTYLDAAHVLPQAVVDNIESNRDKDPNWWNIYGLGLLGKVEGLVHSKFGQVDELPDGACCYGLDFGFLVDPTVLTKHVFIGDSLYSQQMFYEYGELTNDAIARRMDLCGVEKGVDIIYADPNEPKSIKEIAEKGYICREAVKGPGSVAYGIQKVNQFYQYWTKDSLDCIKEQRNYRYLPDREGKLTNNTTHQFSHGIDSRRYAVASHVLPLADNRKPSDYC